RSVEHARILGIDRQIDRADIVRIAALGQYLLPGRSAVDGAIDATIRVRSVDVPQGRYVNTVRIRRVHHDSSDLTRGGEADISPGLARVHGLIHACTVGVLAANVGLA